MISLFDKCIFVHIPKVAGQSIESVFLQRAGFTWQQREKMLLRANPTPELGPPRLAHLLAQEYVSLGYIDEYKFKQMFKFSFVRNPWERLVSEYTYRNYPFSFKDFIFRYFPTAKNDDYFKGFDGYRHIIPQYKFLYNEEGELLVDFVGKFEQLEKDFAKVTKLITGEELLLPHRNQTSKNNLWQKCFVKNNQPKSYQDYYDSESKAFVSEYYQRDIELFGYKFK